MEVIDLIKEFRMELSTFFLNSIDFEPNTQTIVSALVKLFISSNHLSQNVWIYKLLVFPVYTAAKLLYTYYNYIYPANRLGILTNNGILFVLQPSIEYLSLQIRKFSNYLQKKKG